MFFSILQGKHHHYLLQAVAPWAVLGALGAVRLWELMLRSRTWVRSPLAGTVLLGLPISVAVVVLRNKIPGPGWLAFALAGLAPVTAAVLWLGLIQIYYLRGLSLVCGLLIGVHWGAYALRTAYWDRYREDSHFLKESARLVPADKRILVMDDDAPLNASWLLFYLEGRATLLHNITFLRGDDIHEEEVFLIARQKQGLALSQYGTFETVLQSEHSRYESGPEDRYALFHLRFHPNFQRVPGPVDFNTREDWTFDKKNRLTTSATDLHSGRVLRSQQFEYHVNADRLTVVMPQADVAYTLNLLPDGQSLRMHRDRDGLNFLLVRMPATAR